MYEQRRKVEVESENGEKEITFALHSNGFDFTYELVMMYHFIDQPAVVVELPSHLAMACFVLESYGEYEFADDLRRAFCEQSCE